MSELIVDGYNIIHAWPELSVLIKGGNAEEARHRLIGMLGEYSASTGEHVTVVFDAHGRARDHGRGESVDGVTVIFGSSAQTADHVIERRVSIAAGSGDARSVTVATSDRLQRDMVMAMGAAVIGATALLHRVQGVHVELNEHSARRRREAGFANRLEDRLDPQVRARLEHLRRPPARGWASGESIGRVERVATPMRGVLDAVPAVTDIPGALVVRELRVGDAVELGRLMFAAYRGTVDDHGETADWHMQEAARTLSGVYGQVLWDASLVASERHRLVATCVVTEESGPPLLAFALALPEYQGRGLGTALITRSAAHLRTDGYHEWTLAVTRGSPAIRLYQRMGFVPDESLRHSRDQEPPKEGGRA